MIILIMLFLGPIHVIWALVEILITKYRNIRLHFLAYGAGVVLYFLILSQLTWTVFTLEKFLPETVYFYAGAWSLAAYHVWISVRAHRLYRSEKQPLLISDMLPSN